MDFKRAGERQQGLVKELLDRQAIALEKVRKVRASKVAQGVTPLHRKVRTSGTERMSRALILLSGTGDLRGAAGVKTAKLCVKQDQIGERLSVTAQSFRVDCLRPEVTQVSDEW